MKIKCTKCDKEFEFTAIIWNTNTKSIKVKCFNCGSMISVKLERRKNENKDNRFK